MSAVLDTAAGVAEPQYGEDFRAQQRRRYSYYSGWHTDVTASVNPPAASILRAEVVPESVRFRWEPGSVAFWDNRATAHLAPTDLDHLEVERTLHRITLVGDVPVGPDGRESELLAGRPFTATRTEVVVAH